VPPLCLGIAIGGLIGCVLTYTITVLAQRSNARELAAERFNISNVLNAVPDTGSVTFTGDDTETLGRLTGRSGSGSGVRRRIQLQGSIPKGTNPDAFAQQLVAQIDAELNRQGAFQSGGSSSTSSGGNEARQTKDMSYYTRDGRRGFLDLELTVRNERVEGTLILTEGR
jgi:hypothetical protein